MNTVVTKFVSQQAGQKSINGQGKSLISPNLPRKKSSPDTLYSLYILLSRNSISILNNQRESYNILSTVPQGLNPLILEVIIHFIQYNNQWHASVWSGTWPRPAAVHFQHQTFSSLIITHTLQYLGCISAVHAFLVHIFSTSSLFSKPKLYWNNNHISCIY